MADIEDIVKWIVYQSREQGHPVTEALAAYIAHTTINPETNRFYLEENSISDSEASALVNASVQKLANEGDPQVETLRIQISYDSAYVQQESLMQHIQQIQTQETNSYIDEIVNSETTSGNDFEGITLLYKRIFNFLLFRNKQVGLNFAQVITRPGGGLGSVNAITNTVLRPSFASGVVNTIEREVAAALESVLPRPGLRPFVAMSTPEKVSQLMELSNIVVGIRLYNKETGKGGAGLASFEQLVNNSARELLTEINNEVVSTVEACEDYTNFLKHQKDTSETERWKNELTHRRQYLSYLLALQEDVQNSDSLIENLHSRYIRELVELKELIGNKTSIPKDQVYPKFDTLSQVYNQMNEEKNRAVLRKELFGILKDHKEKVHLTLPQENLSDIAERPSSSESVGEVSGSPEAQLLTSQNTTDFMHLPLDFQGFCVWSIAQRQGLLIPGKPTLGVVKYMERNFVLCSTEALQEFIENPGLYLEKCVEVGRKRPELIHLLRMTEEFPKSSLTHLLQGNDGQPLFSVSAPLMLDKDIETPVHFVESHIDPNYNWNEWELRRKALQMADIRKKQTSSMQTKMSAFKRDDETQVYLPKQQETQTGVNSWTEMDPVIDKMYYHAKEKVITPSK
mmetsp:Transcript_8344/g.12308  ORF Transcript_8344/g.12308 Transcript_8344/m.12308 type:complete len:627 (+) Transcript_8344:12-1892(+)